MGTITIEQYQLAGSVNQVDQPIPRLDTGIVTTIDGSTSTTAENITLGSATKIISIYAEETHRVSVVSNTTATSYATINAGERRDFSVSPGTLLYYRLDA